MQQPDEILTLREAATRAKVRPSTVRSWLQHGKIKGLKAGKDWRVRAGDLERFMEEAARVPLRLVKGEQEALNAVNEVLAETDRQ